MLVEPVKSRVSAARTKFSRYPSESRPTLAPSSLGRRPRCVNLVLPGLPKRQTYAGLRTALKVGVLAAYTLSRPLRIVTPRVLRSAEARQAASEVESISKALLGSDMITGTMEFATLSGSVSGLDVWIATYWKTASVLGDAVGRGIIDPEQIVYLIQDYEPGFSPWGTTYWEASETYNHGFLPLVNSAPLADFLRKNTVLDIEDQYVFGPDLNYTALEDAYNSRGSACESAPRLLFYARPSRPRNMFGLGVDALARWSEQMERRAGKLELLTAGEPHPRLPVKNGVKVRRLGMLSLDEYLGLLSHVDVTLALMCSPHPSHVPLEAGCAGSIVVTNGFAEYRQNWHNNLRVVRANAEELAQALAEECLGIGERDVRGFEKPAALGRPLEEATRARFDSFR